MPDGSAHGTNRLAESYSDTTVHGRADYVPYDKRKLTYANTFKNPFKATVIRTLEWSTGKIRLLRLIRRFERDGVVPGQGLLVEMVDGLGAVRFRVVLDVAWDAEGAQATPELGVTERGFTVKLDEAAVAPVGPQHVRGLDDRAGRI